ncbi:uncharacterized protein LOC113310831 isoform X2 [Papaver somniferum]|uniref:uncharacterized protein LOC113310831 isoform X2 n=1 Tax=Papaver somniferum TaxID=3469 RepID=UPI000E7045F2|nr:uncharacterized protein LOC113310831 isoform X2 [Papaver somniferum]
MKSINLLLDRNSPDRDFNDILISIAEKKLESLPEIEDLETMEREEEIAIEKVVTDFSQIPSNSSEVGDASLYLELINSSFLFDEEKDDSSSDIVRLIPFIVDGAGDVGETQKRDSRFLAYQEGKPFIPRTEFVVNFQSKRIAAQEVNGCDMLNLDYNYEFRQFEDQKIIDEDNLNQFSLNSINSIRNQIWVPFVFVI